MYNTSPETVSVLKSDTVASLKLLGSRSHKIENTDLKKYQRSMPKNE